MGKEYWLYGGGTMGSKYTIQEAVVVLNENSEVVEWFDTTEEAEEYVEEMEDE